MRPGAGNQAGRQFFKKNDQSPSAALFIAEAKIVPRIPIKTPGRVVRQRLLHTAGVGWEGNK
jgi:hypothetical protein